MGRRWRSEGSGPQHKVNEHLRAVDVLKLAPCDGCYVLALQPDDSAESQAHESRPQAKCNTPETDATTRTPRPLRRPLRDAGCISKRCHHMTHRLSDSLPSCWSRSITGFWSRSPGQMEPRCCRFSADSASLTRTGAKFDLQAKVAR